MKKNSIIQGDCLDKLKDIDDNSIDSIVTDPPYELGFMGKSWDNTGIANNVEMWKECLRVLKPGGYLLSFSGTRTYHRQAVAIEDAGFEIRDMIEWVYGSGFPKSLNIGKAVDKIQGNERKTVREYETHDIRNAGLMDKKGAMTVSETKGTSEYEGWGTALKPAHEPICLARKPLAEKTVAENVLKYGTGGINIDGCRVGTEEINIHNAPKGTFAGGEPDRGSDTDSYRNSVGRFPANLIHDGSDEVVGLFPQTKQPSIRKGNRDSRKAMFDFGSQDKTNQGYTDVGSAARFFYCAKASKSERNKGCEDMEEKQMGRNQSSLDGGKMLTGSGNERSNTKQNNHPTVKPIALMEYLIKMVTPKGGVVLDPFAGSGSTLVAAKQNGFDYIGIELTAEYIPIIEARLNAVKNIQERLL